MSTKANSDKKNFRPTEFLTECKEELRKVSKPNREETVRATLMALVIMFVFAFILALLDVIFNRIMSAIL